MNAPSGRLRLLYGVQAAAGVGMAAGGTSGSLLAYELTGDLGQSELPLALLIVGATVAVLPVSAVMRRWGRREGLLLGLGVAAAGAALVVVAAVASVGMPLLLVGSFLLGAGNAAVMFGRYVAAEYVESGAAHAGPGNSENGDIPIKDSAAASRAIGAALTAASAGAVLGPNLLGATGAVAIDLGVPAPTGLYLLAVIAFGAALTAASFLPTTPRAMEAAARRGEPQPPTRQKGLLPLVFLLLASANASMVTLMAVAPLQLHAHHGWSYGTIGLAVSGHVAAMFATSALSARLCARFTPWRVAIGGAGLTGSTALLIAAFAEHGDGTAPFVLALVALGFGWNLQLVSGSTLLIRLGAPDTRQRNEARGEISMGSAAALGTFAAGPVLVATGGAGLGMSAAICSLGTCLLLLSQRLPSDEHEIVTVTAVDVPESTPGR